jgi:hypothetical protein
MCIRDRDASDTDIAVKGFLRIAKHLEGAPGKENLLLRLKCLSSASDLLHGTSEREGLSTLVKRMGPDQLSEGDYLESRIDLLEQALSFLEPENRLKNSLMDLARERGFPFVKVRTEDIKGILLSSICDSGWELMEVTLDNLENEEAGPEELEGLAEDLCHNLLMAGNHYQLLGRVGRAREIYEKCREVIDLYEKAVVKHPDHVTEWDIRKVKEVVMLNMSQLA